MALQLPKYVCFSETMSKLVELGDFWDGGANWLDSFFAVQTVN